jgi:L-fuculose-phosphate aldolase
MTMTTERQHREFMCEIGRRLYNKGFAAANDGNITVRLNERELLCTPTMVSKGFMKPEDICKVDYEGKQLAGTRKRTSEVLLHLSVYKHRPDVQAVVHCHPPYATAFAVAQEPIPKCVLPEVEVFLGVVPTAVYETPGNQKFAETIVPHLKDTNTILLANHGTITFGPTLENAYFNSEIIDAYCKILLLAKQLGRINYLSGEHTRELLVFKDRIGYRDPRTGLADCDLCGTQEVEIGVNGYQPTPYAFARGDHEITCPVTPKPSANGQNLAKPSSNGSSISPAAPAVDMELLVQRVTDQVMAALAAV